MPAGSHTQRPPQIKPARVRAWLAAVADPEIPVLSIADLGILRDVQCRDGELVVVITPTYSGCPAMHAIEQAIEAELHRHGVESFQIHTRLAPPWSSDWITPAGRRKLFDYGIAPPAQSASGKRERPDGEPRLACPQCGSAHTTRISEFGSTACKALYRCGDCLEPFDYFKCI
ncbi:MAG: phenylacetate-CoA oxygenase subunit PaaJ [Nitrococcus sp.]|nr:phenylacetate-CoA oxygenase subunit PaaJ [Nitrococcus sp.]